MGVMLCTMWKFKEHLLLCFARGNRTNVSCPGDGIVTSKGTLESRNTHKCAAKTVLASETQVVGMSVKTH